MVAHEDVDLHKTLALSVLLEEGHVFTEEVDVFLVLVELPMLQLGFLPAGALQPGVVPLLISDLQPGFLNGFIVARG
jgi:hypothetical protein